MSRLKPGNWVESLLQDLRYAVRTLRKVPGFTAIVILTLALGVGANTAIFSATYAILLKPLAYRDSDRLVKISLSSPDFAGIDGGLSIPAYQEIEAKTGSFEQVTASRGQIYRFADDSSPKNLDADLVSGNYFRTLGLTPTIGRTILPRDTTLESPRVVMLSYKLWHDRFGADPNIVGKQLSLVAALDSSAVPADYTVIGVGPALVPSEYYWHSDVWVPLVAKKEEPAYLMGDVYSIARLKPGVNVDRADQEIRALSALVTDRYPKYSRGEILHVRRLQDTIVQSSRLELLVLMGAVGFLFLIACVNVSNLTLARSWGRRQEAAIRAALGATRSRIVGQFLVESLLLSLLGGALGLLLGFAGLSLLKANAPFGTPRLDELRMYPAVFWYALAISTCAGLLFGLAPALQVCDQKLQASLKNSAITPFSGEAGRPNLYRQALIVAEVALSVVLLAGSGLAIRSFAKLIHVPLGFRTDHLLTMEFTLAPGTCKQGALCQIAFNEILDRVRALPGVQNATLGQGVLQGFAQFTIFEIPGHPKPAKGQPGPQAKLMAVAPDYFSTMGIPLLHGRDFVKNDNDDSPRVWIVNETFSKKYFSGAPLGKQIPDGAMKNNKLASAEIVGVVGDARDMNPAKAPEPEIYVPVDQTFGTANAQLYIHTAADPNLLVPGIREQVLAVSKSSEIGFVSAMDRVASKSVEEPRFRTFLLGAFAALGLLLAVVGIYGVVSYSVRQRSREIGVRIALGAGPRDVLRLVLIDGLAMTVVGIALGVGAALALTRYLRSLLFEVTPTDPLTFVGVALLFLAVALAACYIPARRAMRVDPMEALRYE
jgi:putative ABC transport system permease protein